MDSNRITYTLELGGADDAEHIALRAADGSVLFEAKGEDRPLDTKVFALHRSDGTAAGTLKQKHTPFMQFDMVRVAVRLEGAGEVEVVRDMEEMHIVFRAHGEGFSLGNKAGEDTIVLARDGEDVAWVRLADDGRSEILIAANAPRDLVCAVAVATCMVVGAARPRK